MLAKLGLHQKGRHNRGPSKPTPYHARCCPSTRSSCQRDLGGWRGNRYKWFHYRRQKTPSIEQCIFRGWAAWTWSLISLGGLWGKWALILTWIGGTHARYRQTWLQRGKGRLWRWIGLDWFPSSAVCHKCWQFLRKSKWLHSPWNRWEGFGTLSARLPASTLWVFYRHGH